MLTNKKNLNKPKKIAFQLTQTITKILILPCQWSLKEPLPPKNAYPGDDTKLHLMVRHLVE